MATYSRRDFVAKATPVKSITPFSKIAAQVGITISVVFTIIFTLTTLYEHAAGIAIH